MRTWPPLRTDSCLSQPPVRILIVKLSSLGDVVHAMPVVHDILQAHPGAVIDWVVEPGFAPLVRRVDGVDQVIECSLRKWRKAWWTGDVRAQWRAFRQRLQRDSYDSVLDLQGLTKSALVARMARGVSYGLGNRTDGSGYEAPARWLVDQAIQMPPHIHALDRSRELAARALQHSVVGAPQFGLRAVVNSAIQPLRPILVMVHGTSRDDKLWPEAHWIALGERAIAQGWCIALPHAGEVEWARAHRIATALNTTAHDAAKVWPAMSLDALVDQLGTSQSVVGVDSGLSHMAVALNLPHVQIYNWPTAWRTGPQAAHGHRHQMSIEPEAQQTTPSFEAVWAAWIQVVGAGRLELEKI
jgi:heptosyltransferase I